MSGKQVEPCCLRPDHPKVGDYVRVIREHHGWHDGRIGGRVLSLVHHENQIGISYVIRTDEIGDVVCLSRGDCIVDYFRN